MPDRHYGKYKKCREVQEEKKVQRCGAKHKPKKQLLAGTLEAEQMFIRGEEYLNMAQPFNVGLEIEIVI